MSRLYAVSRNEVEGHEIEQIVCADHAQAAVDYVVDPCARYWSDTPDGEGPIDPQTWIDKDCEDMMRAEFDTPFCVLRIELLASEITGFPDFAKCEVAEHDPITILKRLGVLALSPN